MASHYTLIKQSNLSVVYLEEQATVIIYADLS
jgi:hypothetical protein